MLIQVQNGTGAGRKRVKTVERRNWMHVCQPPSNGVLLDGAYARCPRCGCKRPT